MAEEPREIPQVTTGIPFNDEVSTSPTKKRTEPTAFYLFGTRIPLQDSSSLASKETNEVVSLAICLNPNANLEVTYADHKEETEEARKIKKMRFDLSKEELREEENRTGVSTELPLDIWTIKKTLTTSDINGLTRLLVATSAAEEHIMPHLSPAVQMTIQDGNGVEVKVYDHDTNTEHNMVLKRMKTTRSYVFNGGWGKEFVLRRKLKQGYKIGLFWSTVESRLHFCVLSTVPADQKNPN